LPDDRYSQYYLKTLIVTNTYLNMRSGPGTNYRIVRRLEEDQLLTFLAMTGSWVKVRIRGGKTIGFVHMNYIAVITD
jgi:N-acetylmuramoyl-L-alanine amidase